MLSRSAWLVAFSTIRTACSSTSKVRQSRSPSSPAGCGSRPPPLARVSSVTAEDAPPVGSSGFRIADSDDAGSADVPICIDTATCPDCLAEVDDRADRRYGYPFTNCTNCGPRYTIVTGVPYDRPNTTMAGFGLCDECRAEYDDPADRRFHAQPNACPACGPRLSWRDGRGVVLARRPCGAGRSRRRPPAREDPRPEGHRRLSPGRRRHRHRGRGRAEETQGSRRQALRGDGRRRGRGGSPVRPRRARPRCALRRRGSRSCSHRDSPAQTWRTVWPRTWPSWGSCFRTARSTTSCSGRSVGRSS